MYSSFLLLTRSRKCSLPRWLLVPPPRPHRTSLAWGVATLILGQVDGSMGAFLAVVAVAVLPASVAVAAVGETILLLPLPPAEAASVAAAAADASTVATAVLPSPAPIAIAAMALIPLGLAGDKQGSLPVLTTREEWLICPLAAAMRVSTAVAVSASTEAVTAKVDPPRSLSAAAAALLPRASRRESLPLFLSLPWPFSPSIPSLLVVVLAVSLPPPPPDGVVVTTGAIVPDVVVSCVRFVAAPLELLLAPAVSIAILLVDCYAAALPLSDI
mmetsp:Transcript_2998/g.6491  ORF Transcript_2998/g.6491 Transcript_2998/m.6491 type:complete len:272 (+) Transcript_2998:1660-2475(+)